MKKKLTIGSRGSMLALWQSNWAKAALLEKFPELSIEIEIIKTKGDKILDVPLAKIGDAGLFVKELEDALLEGRIDFAVHSMKDMPAMLTEGMTIGCVPVRETPNDVLITSDGKTFEQLPQGAKLGTSSLRRVSQLLHARPDIETVPIRGNLDTRLKKLETENLDGILLAAAGLKRLGFENVITEYLDYDLMLPAVGQGALCIETREGDTEILEILSTIHDPKQDLVVKGERAFLRELKGGCQVPIAAHGIVTDDGKYEISGLVANLDGSVVIRETLTGDLQDSEKMGTKLARNLVERGAGEILEKIKADAK